MKGICFIEPLFKSVVESKKTQTRRIINPQPIDVVCSTIIDNTLLLECFNENDARVLIKPKYKVGETIYLKEPYYIDNVGYHYKYLIENPIDALPYEILSGIEKWNNKLFMPASAARYFIKITDVRAERLQNISEEDCIREGIIAIPQRCNAPFIYDNRSDGERYNTPKQAYSALINSINGKGTWQSNPFVWVYDFELTDNQNKEDKL